MTEALPYQRKKFREHPKGCRCRDCVAERKATARRLYQETDMSIQQIANHLGMTRWTLDYHLKAMGLKA